MKPLRRHQLTWLDEYAWFRVLTRAWASSEQPQGQAPYAIDCLDHWAQRRWPLVVTRQVAEPIVNQADGFLALGLPAPARWHHRPIGICASVHGVMKQGEFPLAVDLGAMLPAPARAGWEALCDRLARLGVVARVYGSYGWQQLTGLDYVHPGSDIDVLLDVTTPAQADRACALLAADSGPLRIDGELAFENGASVAWREWLRFRSGESAHILVKRLNGATLEDATTWAAIA